MTYRAPPLSSLVFALLVGCSEDTSDGSCEPDNVVDDGDEPIDQAVASTGSGEERLALARDFVEAVLIDNDPQAAARFLGPGAVLPAPGGGLRYGALSRVRVEGDWVVAESEASLAGVAQVAYDRFRVQRGRILEHRREAIVDEPGVQHVVQPALAGAAHGVSAE